jgi:hypothetical protein
MGTFCLRLIMATPERPIPIESHVGRAPASQMGDEPSQFLHADGDKKRRFDRAPREGDEPHRARKCGSAWDRPPIGARADDQQMSRLVGRADQSDAMADQPIAEAGRELRLDSDPAIPLRLGSVPLRRSPLRRFRFARRRIVEIAHRLAAPTPAICVCNQRLRHSRDGTALKSAMRASPEVEPMNH